MYEKLLSISSTKIDLHRSVMLISKANMALQRLILDGSSDWEGQDFLLLYTAQYMKWYLCSISSILWNNISHYSTITQHMLHPTVSLHHQPTRGHHLGYFKRVLLALEGLSWWSLFGWWLGMHRYSRWRLKLWGIWCITLIKNNVESYNIEAQ